MYDEKPRTGNSELFQNSYKEKIATNVQRAFEHSTDDKETEK